MNTSTTFDMDSVYLSTSPNVDDKINIDLNDNNFHIELNPTENFKMNHTAVNHKFKYNEAQILKDIQEYVSETYNSHYTGQDPSYRDIQTIDLMATKDLASNFCQANILKYGSRYGSKDGHNKKDLMKVIHYAMLLLHFDSHYDKPNTNNYFC
jgi:hypothetical protein